MINTISNAIGSGLDALMNLVPSYGKVTFLPVSKFDPVPIPNGPPFIAMFNPETWQRKEEYVYEDKQPKGENEATQVFGLIKSPEISFELLIDGTGASGVNKEVTAEIALLKRTVGFNGGEHRPNKLFIIWGYFMFPGVLSSMDINYTLFRPNGTPLRAKITLTFKRDNEVKSKILQMNLLSSDLTHMRIIQQNQRLEQVSTAIYDSNRFHLEVAKANNLTSFRQDLTGRNLEFPPIEK
jgi:hypothetical protein